MKYKLICPKCKNQQDYKPKNNILKDSHTKCKNCRNDIFFKKEDIIKIVSKDELKQKILSAADPHKEACIIGSCEPFINYIMSSLNHFNKIHESKISLRKAIEIAKYIEQLIFKKGTGWDKPKNIKMATICCIISDLPQKNIVEYFKCAKSSINNFYKWLEINDDKNKIVLRRNHRDSLSRKEISFFYEICESCYHINSMSKYCEICGEKILIPKRPYFWKEHNFKAILKGLQNLSKQLGIKKSKMSFYHLNMVRSLYKVICNYFGGWDNLKKLLLNDFIWKKKVDKSKLKHYSRYPTIILGEKTIKEVFL